MYTQEQGLYIAHGQNGPIVLNGAMVNRHGLVAGATGTGKTVSLQVMAESFCQAGVPCFMADMKGDLSGISQAGHLTGFIEKRMAEFGIHNPTFQSCPVRFFDVYGEQGHPMRATISDMGPELLTRLLELNDTQAGILNIVFRVADERGLLIIDMKDLRSMLDYVGQHAKEYTTKYGNISSASIGAIQRSLLQLESQGADKFFGEPSFDINDLLQTEGGKGIMNVLAADKLMLQPKLYSTFLLWLISELYTALPEVGDQPLPKLVFFFDEAHMLFDGTSKALIDKIEQVIRLIRSKGVGIFMITQSPTDIPLNILGQLGNRVQHALRAYTPKDQKAVRAAAETFRANPAFKTEEAITNLETGEALVSFLDAKGAPQVVERAKMLFPLSQIGAITDEQRKAIIAQSKLGIKYDQPIDRVSAYEQLMQMKQQAEQEVAEDSDKTTPTSAEHSGNTLFGKILKSVITALTATFASIIGTAVSNKVTGKKSRSRTSTTERAVKNATSAATRTMTREITRSILGNLVK
ncbi:helicase HerA-like domain-containing protein [Hoylesella timonensis]|uniref:helicase HerA-like domain-containing protein n=1 Tax=Hoylesella timonensis TaxID=386414 RepID=UPI00242CDEEF|nr:helicase HerA-like domain-containing protein [Hoylesella timonensis]